MINFNTPEVQAAREQFRQKIDAQKMALKNAPRLLSTKPKKERPTKK